LPQLEHLNWDIGTMDSWNDGVGRRKTKNPLFPILIPIIPLFQQSIIPIPQKIALRNNGITPRIEEAPVFFLLAIFIYLC